MTLTNDPNDTSTSQSSLATTNDNDLFFWCDLRCCVASAQWSDSTFCVSFVMEQKSHVFARCLAESRQKIVSNKFQQQSNLEFPMILNWINFRHPNWIRGRQKSYKFWWRCCGQVGTVKKFNKISVFSVRIILIYCLTGFLCNEHIWCTWEYCGGSESHLIWAWLCRLLSLFDQTF